MEDIYELIIDDKLFQKFLNRKFAYLISVNDKDKQLYKQDNLLTLKSDNQSEKKVIKAKVSSLLFFTTLKELVEMVGKDKCGFRETTSVDAIEDIFRDRFNAKDIEKYGFVAIGVELLKD